MAYNFRFIVRLMDRGIGFLQIFEVDTPEYDSLILLHKDELPVLNLSAFGG